jgi:hypothetical protein
MYERFHKNNICQCELTFFGDCFGRANALCFFNTNKTKETFDINKVSLVLLRF